jgi:hypothetical protein
LLIFIMNSMSNSGSRCKQLRLLKEENVAIFKNQMKAHEEGCAKRDINEDLQLALEEYAKDPQGCNVSQLCEKYAISRQTFVRHRDRIQAGENPAGRKVGRKAWQSEAQTIAQIEKGHDLALVKNAYDSTPGGVFVQDMILNHQTAQGQSISRLSRHQVPSKSTVQKFLKISAPVSTNQPSTVNERREEAMRDSYNAISTAAMLYAVLNVSNDHPNGDRFLPWNITNTDTQCVMLGTTRKIKARTPQGMVALLKEVRLSVSRTEPKHKVRSVKNTPTIAVSGELLSFVTVIKERRCTETKVFQFQMSGYKLFVIFRPAIFRSAIFRPPGSDVEGADDDDGVSETDVIEMEIEDPLKSWRENLRRLVSDSTLNLEEENEQDTAESAETEFAKVVLDKCILPALVESRDAKMARDGRQDEDRDPLLFTLDGEFGLMRSLIRGLMSKFKPNNIMFF